MALNLVLAVFLSAQLVIPITYYLGDNPFDERFSWRMFSPVRLAGCSVRLFEVVGGEKRRIKLGQRFHVVWVNLLKRNRPSVAMAVGAKLCREASSASQFPDIRIAITCDVPDAMHRGICKDRRDLDGDRIPDGYKKDPSCDGDLAACFRRDCGQSDLDDTQDVQVINARACAAEVCQAIAFSESDNICEQVSWQ